MVSATQDFVDAICWLERMRDTTDDVERNAAAAAILLDYLNSERRAEERREYADTPMMKDVMGVRDRYHSALLVLANVEFRGNQDYEFVMNFVHGIANGALAE